MAPDEPIAQDAYDTLAETYDEEIGENAYNAHLEFPATTALLGDVNGDRILDAGCGTGRYTEWLLEQGADVVGVDVSEEMLARCRNRVGDQATIHQADLAHPLEFAADDSFDGVLSSLALGYVEDWSTPLSAFARILRPGGFLVFSVIHPMDAFRVQREDSSYFDVERQTKAWTIDVPYYRRPLSAMFNPLLDEGFRLDRISEPQPTEKFARKRPERYETEQREPVFLCVKATLQ